MRMRSSAIAAVAALLVALPASAEPTPSKPRPDKSSAEPAPVLLASATMVSVPKPRKDDQVDPAPKKRTARVTSCRCGDPDPR